jgi:hypothetical protein
MISGVRQVAEASIVWARASNVMIGSFGIEAKMVPEGEISKTQNLGSGRRECKGRGRKNSARHDGTNVGVKAGRGAAFPPGPAEPVQPASYTQRAKNL